MILAAWSIPVPQPWLATILAVVLASAWLGMHLLRRRRGTAGFWLSTLGAMGMAAGAAWCLLALLDHVVVLATAWPIWPIAVLAAISVEMVLWLYQLERRSVGRRVGWVLCVLRVVLVLLVVTILTQPVRSHTQRKEDPRYVAVLVDDSASMYIKDTQLSLPERLRLAEMLDVDVPARPWRLEEVHQQLRRVGADLAGQLDPLEQLKSLPPDQRGRALANRAETMHRLFEQRQAQVRQAMERLRAPVEADESALSDQVKRRLSSSAAALQTGVADALQRLARLTEPERRDQLRRRAEVLVEDLSAATGQLRKLLPDVARLADDVDAAFYKQLGPDLRGRITTASDRTRAAIAGRALLDEASDEKGHLLDRIGSAYALRLYRFDAEIRPTDAGALEQPIDEADDRRAEPEALRTDLAGALEAVLEDLGPEQLSGVIIVSDGAASDPRKVSALTDRFAAADVPVSGILIGGARPPRDASIVHVEAPEALRPGDRFEVRARIRAEGLKGRSLKLRLVEADQTAAEKTIDVPSESFTTVVSLGAAPETEGLRDYRLLLDPAEGEAVTENNTSRLPVTVRDDRVHLLLIEGRPRWEFRYLKNLFSDRDPGVKLQYVLLEPDRVAKDEPSDRRKVVASVAADDSSVEATVLPGNVNEQMSASRRSEEIIREWLKFDVVILGDVDPGKLREADAEALRRFVMDKGGSLVVIAGPRFTPHAWEESTAWPLMPVDLAETTKNNKELLDGFKQGFRLNLTSEGRGHPTMQLGPDAAATEAVWHDLPEIYWRHPLCRARRGASVLAYAMSDSDAGRLAPPPASASLAKRREHRDILRAHRRNHAMMIHQAVGRGQVLMLCFDRTWRLRYRVGDANHHRYWGQVVRWATADRLRSGTRLVRLGTDRLRYDPGDAVEIRARVLQTDFAPLISDDIFVHVVDQQGATVARSRMSVDNRRRGTYRAKLAPLPRGIYRAALEGEQIDTILRADDAGAGRVETDFAVSSGVETELADLQRQPAGLAALAEASGGAVVDPAGSARTFSTLGEPSKVRIIRDDWRIWDSWPLLILIFAVAAGEWIVRKKVQLP